MMTSNPTIIRIFFILIERYRFKLYINLIDVVDLVFTNNIIDEDTHHTDGNSIANESE